MSRKRFLGKYDKMKYGWLHFAIEFVVGAILFLIIVSFVIGVSRVDGVSMEPTLTDNQVVVFTRHHSSYEQGQIIAIKMPEGDSYVKRVVALPGDIVDVEDGKVLVNGSELEESYATGVTDGGNQVYPLTIPENKVFALGDNRENSVDSREFGPVSYSAIKGILVGKK